MRILATISDGVRLALVLDLKSGETQAIPVQRGFVDATVFGRAACRPFGITWNFNELFIANNRQMLVFDKQLGFLRTLTTQLQINVHQLAFRDGIVWAVSPWTNSLIGLHQNSDAKPIEFDLCKQQIYPYVERETNEADDEWHFNSLLFVEDDLFVASHAFGGHSFINQYDSATFQLKGVYRDVGSSIHGLARHEGELFWLSTKTCEIRSERGYCVPLTRPGYARGFAMTRRYFVVAISEFLSRGDRHTGDSWIQLIDRREGIPSNEYHLADTGSINDLRLLDSYDFAHGVAPFWSDRH